MGKNKKGKKTSVREKLKKSENPKAEVKVNPFELRINHERYKILGRKPKNDKGMPGVSRNKAIKKRKEFMLKNKLLTSKSNRFIDKRIGEYDKSVLKEDLIAARLIHERRKKLKRNIYNLNDDEELTHLGKPISLLETMDNPISDSDDEDEDKLNADFVEEAHFGGFLTKKNSDESSRTHKEIIGDLILESKRRKEERKLEKEKNMDLTEQLDKEFKKVMSKFGSLKQETQTSAPQKDQYDMIVQELKFESRGTPASRLKTPEEIAKEEKERLEKLEQDRLLRMADSTENKQVSDRLMSADSIYDGLELDDDFMLASDEDGNASQETKKPNEVDKSIENTDDGSENSQNDDEEEEEDVYSDLDSGSEEDEEEDDDDEENEHGEDEVEMKDVINPVAVTSTKSLSHKMSCVETFEEFLELISAQNEKVSVIVEKIIKYNHPSLSDGNRKKMETLFKILLDYVCHVCQEADGTKVVNSLVPHLYSLAEMSPLNCAFAFRDALLTNYELLKKQKKSSAHKNYFPHLSSLIILKLCGILYSTSDFKHPVVIVAMLYMSDVLSHKFLITYENLISRLFITNLFYEYIMLSKRFVPEAINFLQTVIFFSSVKGPNSAQFCKSACTGDKDLLLVTSVEEYEPRKISLNMLSNAPIESRDNLKLSLLNNAVKQLLYYVGIYSALPSFPELFSPIHSLLNNLPMECYPASLKHSITRLGDEIATMLSNTRTFVVFPIKRPRPLKLFEPAFDMNFGGKKENQSKKMKLVKDLSKKVKREEKGVIREVRRDAQFLARQQLQEKMERDEERKNKVRKLFQDLAAQQGEIKSMSKKK